MTGPPRVRWLLPGELAAVGVIGGGLFTLTGLSVIWVLGGVLGAWLACRIARATHAAAEPSANIRKLGQLLVGAAIGPTIATQTLSVSTGQLALLLGGVAAILLGSLVVARCYAAFGGVDGLTAGMATLPGGIGIMPSVAAEYGKPVGLVAIVQSFRMTLVLLVALALVAGAETDPAGAVTDEPEFLPATGVRWLYLAGLLGGSFVAAWLAKKARVPVPTLLGPLLYGCALSLSLRGLGADPTLLGAPLAQEIVGQALLGITIGEYLAQRYTDGLSRLLGGLAGVMATCGLALLIALGMSTVGSWSPLAAFLMVAPGGAPEMVVIAAAVSGDGLAFVLAAQTGRQVAVNLLMPLWITLFTRFDNPRRS
jgi:hypothetical protein